MPLSEHEQRLLDQIEQALYAEDPKWANTVRISDPRSHYKRRLVKASIGFALGVVLLMVGAVAAQIWLGAHAASWSCWQPACGACRAGSA